MREFVNKYYKTLIFFGVIGIIGGFFVGLYTLDSYPREVRDMLVEEIKKSGLGEIPTDVLLGVITAAQSLGYGVILGAVGIFVAKKIGLFCDDISIEKRPLIASVLTALLGGAAMILPDMLFFASHSEAIAESYASKPSIVYILASVTYGAVIEEVMLRLFMLSLVALILHKLFGGGEEKPRARVLIAANAISALLFAVGHLPATFLLLGDSPLLIVRCLLLNGALGAAFGWLYYKHGLRYAMIAHGGCHIVSKLIWLLFI